MKNAKHDILTSIISKYVLPAKKLHPLTAESMIWHFSRLCDEEISETRLIEAFISMNYLPIGDQYSPKFKIRFIRDKHVDGLFDYYDTSTCQSELLQHLIQNACDNSDMRIRSFCDYAIHQSELCDEEVTDNDVIDYLQWLTRHAPSPKSTLAAVSLYQLSQTNHDIVMNLTPDQLQFIRENPHLQLNTKICK
jgi:hypothetical protein